MGVPFFTYLYRLDQKSYGLDLPTFNPSPEYVYSTYKVDRLATFAAGLLLLTYNFKNTLCKAISTSCGAFIMTTLPSTIAASAEGCGEDPAVTKQAVDDFVLAMRVYLGDEFADRLENYLLSENDDFSPDELVEEIRQALFEIDEVKEEIERNPSLLEDDSNMGSSSTINNSFSSRKDSSSSNKDKSSSSRKDSSSSKKDDTSSDTGNSSSSKPDDTSSQKESSSSESESSSNNSTGDDNAADDIADNDSKTSSAEETKFDPLILDVDNDGYDINTKKSGTYFDLNCDDFAEKINWTSRDGILAIDKNGNSKIDNGNEVFGDSFVLDNGKKAENGFEALKQYDTNGDNFIDSNDKDFDKLLLWLDSNGNGKSEASELSKLSENKIAKICLDYVTINEITDSEAIMGNESYYEYTNGAICKIGEMWVSSDLYDAMELIIAEPTEEIAGLPNVRSFGKVNSLHTAMVNDKTGKLRELVVNFTQETDHDLRIELVKQMLDIMCKTSSIDSKSRGKYVDAKHLAVVEAILGRDFVGTNGIDPNPNAGKIMENVYNNLVDVYYYAIISSDVYEYISYITSVTDENITLFDMTEFNQITLSSLKNGKIDEYKFVDICAYLNYYSRLKLGDSRLMLEFADYVTANDAEYIDLVYMAFYDAIRGTVGDDEIIGTSSSDVIIADDGDDVVNGGKGDDSIVGGAGNDYLEGGAGNDTYLFGIGYGQDTIYENNYYDNDTVVFGKGITYDNTNFVRAGNDLVVSIEGTDDTLTIKNCYEKQHHLVENYKFADGKTITSDEIFSTSIVHGSGEIKDFTKGYGTRNSTLIGSEGDDEMYGYGGNDTLDGREGDDYLEGGAGNDTYLFGLGYGHDTIYEDSFYDNDMVVFGEGISSDKTKFVRCGNDLVITVNGTDDTLTIADYYTSKYHLVEIFEFVDGKTITSDDVLNISTIYGSGVINDFTSGLGTRNSTIIGSEKDDEIYGYGGNDILDGGTGDDYLDGGAGNDTYLFGLGYGHDTIYENRYYDKDTVIFGEGISLEDIGIGRDDYDLILTVSNGEDSIRIKEYFYSNSHVVEIFEFADGTIAEFDKKTMDFIIKVYGDDFKENVTKADDEIITDVILTDEEDTNSAKIA